MVDSDDLDALFDLKPEPPKQAVELPDFFTFEQEGAEKGDKKFQRFVYYRCGTRWALRVLDGAENGDVVTANVPLFATDDVRPFTRPKDGHVMAMPVSVVDIGYFANVTKVTRMGEFAQMLSFGSDYKIEGKTLVLLERIQPHHKVQVEGTAAAAGMAVIDEDRNPKNFPFPYEPKQVGIKPLCNLCPNQFACLAGTARTFGVAEHKVVQMIVGEGNDPLQYT